MAPSIRGTQQYSKKRGDSNTTIKGEIEALLYVSSKEVLNFFD
jgi:hypothetical protein